MVTCTLAKPLGVGPKSAVALLVKGTAAPATPLRYAVAADPPAGTTDPEPGNNKATLANPGAGQADVAVVASGASDPVDAGTTVSLTYTVTDRGPADATGVVVTATLPKGIGLDSSSTGCTAAGQTLTCPAIPTLAAGASVAMVVTLAVDAAQPAGTVLHAVRLAAAAPGDPNESNRIAYAPITVTRRASLGLTASRADGPLAAGRGIIVADTKIELGWSAGGTLVLGDELLTPDSSRFWPASQWQPGKPQFSFDKQYLRDWAAGTGWDKRSAPPEVPPEVVEATRARYVEAWERLTGQPW